MTYRELDERLQSTAAALRQLRLDPPVLALAEENAADGLLLLLATLDAGYRVAVIDPDEAEDVLERQVAQAGATTVVAWSRPGRAASLSTRLVTCEGLPRSRAGPAQVARPAPPRTTVVMLPGPKGLVGHSHFTLAAMATNLTSFVPKLRSLDFLTDRRLHDWEALTGALGALLAGRVVAFGLPDDELVRLDETYTVLKQEQADAIVENGRDQDGWGKLRYVFASIGPFAPKWRRRLEAVLGQAVLPLWGSVEVGPAVAAHPTWYPVNAHGIPLVNVMLVPIDPASGRPSEVPWAMLYQAQLGVDSPSGMIGLVGAETGQDSRVGDVVRTTALVEIDSVGLVRFLG